MKELYADDPPFVDVALTLRSCGCGYMIVLAMYLNTLLMIAVSIKHRARAPQEEAPQLVFRPTARREAKTVPEKKEPDMGPIGKYDEAQTQEELVQAVEAQSPQLLPLAHTAPAEPPSIKAAVEKEKPKEKEKEKDKEKTIEKEPKDKTLKSARMSIRLPRAPKGHHDEELEQMEKFLAEDDMSAIEK